MPASVPDLSIVVPTYREAGNLPVLIPRIARALADRAIDWELIVVDDNSPDGTRDVCAQLARVFPLRLIVRTEERGLSSAVVAGLRAARGEVVLCMDADLSHPPEAVPAMVEALRTGGSDFVIGSRSTDGGSTEAGWGLFRWLNSRVATWLARPLIRVSDPMAGLFALRRDSFVAAEALLHPIGCKIGLELLIKCGSRRVAEVPIRFANRLHGESKLSLREQVNSLRHLGRLYAFRFPVLAQLARFGAVGLSGMAVDLAAFATLLAGGVGVPAASAVAIGTAMTWNFCGNRLWTFAECRRDSWLRQYVTFCGSCLVGGMLNWTTRVLLWRSVPFFTGHELLAAIVGVAAGTGSNFVLCRKLVFRRGRGQGPAARRGAIADDAAADAPGAEQPTLSASRGALPRVDRTRGAAGGASRLAQVVRLLLLVAWLLVHGRGLAAEAEPSARIDRSAAAVEQRLREAAVYLSSDDLEGRGVRTRGLDLAAEYLAREFAACGLRTDHYNGAPFHEFKLYSRATKGSVQELALQAGEQRRELKPDSDFTSLTLSANAPLSLPLVFAGYGITAPEYGYDDYAGVDVAGKAVIVLRREPRQGDPQSVFNGTSNSDHAFLRTKIDNAVGHGAAMLILCTDEFALRSSGEGMAPPVDELLRVELDDSSLRGAIPVVHCRRAVVAGLLQDVLGESLADLEAQIDAWLVPRSRELPECRVKARVGLGREGRTLRNVVASLEGAGPLAEETLIIGAHYDHLGRGGWGSLATGANDEVHNGADDNASGTAVLLELARQLAARDQPLKRRILFIAFSAEELGLIGSTKYVQDPLVPLSSTVAMLNLDMVGRLRENRLTVYGTGTAAEWPEYLQRANLPLGLSIVRHPGGYGPSDHATFFESGVPVLHFFTGYHNQYHRPTDDAELLNLEGMRRITDLVREIAVSIAQAPQRPRPNRSGALERAELGEFEADPDYQLTDDRPLLGVILAPAEPQGVRVRRLLRNAVAERHGIRVGDVLLAVDGQPVNSADAVIEALRGHSLNEPLKIRLQRRGAELELEIRF